MPAFAVGFTYLKTKRDDGLLIEDAKNEDDAFNQVVKWAKEPIIVNAIQDMSEDA